MKKDTGRKWSEKIRGKKKKCEAGGNNNIKVKKGCQKLTE